MFEGLIVKGALMAIGGGGAAVFMGFVGWAIVQFVLAKYGKKKNGNGDSAESHNAIITAIENVRREQKVDMGDMRKDNTASFRRVHERIDRLLEVKRA